MDFLNLIISLWRCFHFLVYPMSISITSCIINLRLIKSIHIAIYFNLFSSVTIFLRAINLFSALSYNELLDRADALRDLGLKPLLLCVLACFMCVRVALVSSMLNIKLLCAFMQQFATFFGQILSRTLQLTCLTK